MKLLIEYESIIQKVLLTIESILQNTKQLQHAQFYFVVSGFKITGHGNHDNNLVSHCTSCPPTAPVLGPLPYIGTILFHRRYTLLSWRWRRHIPPKRRGTFNWLLDVISQKTQVFKLSLAFRCFPQSFRANAGIVPLSSIRFQAITQYRAPIPRYTAYTAYILSLLKHTSH
jgi:hypothetical protein